MAKRSFVGIEAGKVLFKRFEVIEALDTSSVGGVYLCRIKTDSNSLTALKVLHKRSVPGTKPGYSLTREIEVARRIKSPYIVANHALHEDKEFLGLEMEYLTGGSLAARLSLGRRLSIPRVTDILKQISQGLEAIHHSGVIHRDLTPENIFFDDNGSAKIGDFGIAVNFGEKSDIEDHLVGTLNYLSPEYIRFGRVNEQTDIYSLGVIAYELITGRLPFRGNNLIESLLLSANNDPVRPRRLRPSCPLALERFALRAIARAPEKRFRSASEATGFLESLDQLETELSSASSDMLIPVHLAAELSIELDNQ